MDANYALETHVEAISLATNQSLARTAGSGTEEIATLEEQTMNSQTTTQTATDEDAIRAIHQRMIDAWNAGDGAAFAAHLTDDADFVGWQGTHLKGRQEIASFTQRVFDTVVTGSHLEGEVIFVRLLSPRWR